MAGSSGTLVTRGQRGPPPSTPPRSTRTRATVSYAEPSGSSEDELESHAPTSDEEDESEDESDNDEAPRPTRTLRTPRVPRTPQRITRASRARSSTGKLKRNRVASRSVTPTYKSTPKRRKIAEALSRSPSPFYRSTQKRRKFGTKSPSKVNAAVTTTTDAIQGSGIIPLWQTLEYQVLVRIFQYASYPLCDESTFHPTPSLHWLLDLAVMCRAFAEAVATVLLASPPLVPMSKAHMLARLLKGDPATQRYGYKKMVDTLRIDVGQVVAYSLTGSGHLDLFNLIKNLPRLNNLEFFHQLDMAPYRNLNDTIKWTYPEEIFKALEYVDPAADGDRGDKVYIRTLKSWRWSSRLAGKKYPIDQLATLHSKIYFQSLRKLAFVNYQQTTRKTEEEVGPFHESALAKAVNALPKLEHLIFESSTLVNNKLMRLLPANLRQLEIINCPLFVAENLEAFLFSARQLRVLVLNHNKSLDLSFLPSLGNCCPKLQVLRMNLTFYNAHATYKDSEPLFKQLLLPEQVPVWPSTLQVLELIQLRNWSPESAEMFFDSLIDSSEKLSDLRKLIIQAIISVGWRDRATFRDQWCGSLTRVFKRVSDPPQPIFTLPRPILEIEASAQEASDHEEEEQTSESGPSRRSFRSTTQKALTGRYAESDSGSESAASDSEAVPSEDEDILPPSPVLTHRQRAHQAHMKRELEVLKQTASGFTSMDSSADDDADAFRRSPKKDKKKKGKEFIQGMCDIVEIRIDNLRPTENEFTEADFLDDERSGDEDWDGEE